MNYRTIAIRVLVLSLCIAAFSGIAVLLIPSATSIIHKLIGTACLTALSAAFLLCAIRALETTSFRLFGTTLAALVCFIYLCINGAMWSDSISAFRTIELPSKLGLTAAISSGCGLCLLIGAGFTASRRFAISGIIFYIIWLLILITWIVHFWFISLNPSDEFVYFLVPIQNYSPFFAIMFSYRTNLMRIAGAIITVSACILVQYSLLSFDGVFTNSHFLLQTVLVLSWVTAMLAIWLVITFRNARTAMPKCEIGTVILIGISLACFCLLIWYQESTSQNTKAPELLIRASTSFAILASTALLGLLIGRSIRANTFLYQSKGGLSAICPRCKQKVTLPQGKSKCLHCGLSFKIQMEVTGCRVCHYDLMGLTNLDTCPECGEPILLASAVE